MQTLGVSVKQLRRKLLELGARILHVQGSKPRDMALVMLSVSQGMEIGSSGRGSTAENDPTVGAMGGGIGGGDGGSGGGNRRLRDIAVARDRHVRSKSVQQDLALNLPVQIELPDGEEHPYGAHLDLHLRNSEQESEIYQKCVRGPPNRTVFDSESPPPYRTPPPNSNQHFHCPLLSHSPSSSSVPSTTRSVIKKFPSYAISSSTPMPISKPPFSSYSESSSNMSSNLSSSNLSNITVVPCETDESRQEQQQQPSQPQPQPQQQQPQHQQQQLHQKV